MNRSLTLKVNKTKGLEYHVDANFISGQTPSDPLNLGNFLLRSGFIIAYARFPIFQRSKSPTKIALSIYDTECITLSAAMREVILLIQLLKDLKVNCSMGDTSLEVYYKVFKDNQSYIAVAESKKPPTRTKHITIEYYHFRSLVDNKTIRIKCIDSKK